MSDLFDGYGEHARGLTKAALDEMVGRDYSDVPPVKGIYAENAEHTMKVGVRIMRTH